jgi:hypothetical protein
MERMPKVRRFSESYELRYVINAQAGGTEILLREVATDVVENLRK